MNVTVQQCVQVSQRLALASALVLGACGAVQAKSAFSGAYVGVGAKAGFLKTSAGAVDYYGAQQGTAYSFGSGTTSSQKKTAWAGDVLAGYGFDLDDFFVSAELMGSFGNITQNKVFNGAVPSGTTNYNVAGTFSVKSRFGALARLGFVLTPSVLGYVGLGVQVARLTTTWSDARVVANNPTPAVGKVTKTAVLFTPTVGAEVNLFGNTSARLEYTYVKYPTQTVNVGDITADNSTLTLRPTEQQVRLALVWRF